MLETKQIFMRILKEYEKTLEVKYTLILNIVNNLSNLYKNQDKLIKTKQIYMRALKEYKKILEVEYTLIFNIINNLNLLYND